MKLLEKIGQAISDAGATYTELDGEPFAIFPDYENVSAFNQNLNRMLVPALWDVWQPVYDALALLKGKRAPYHDLRLGQIRLEDLYDDNWRLGNDVEKLRAYWIVKDAIDKDEDGLLTGYHFQVPDGLFDLDSEEIIDWGFDDHYSVCDGCGKAIRTQPDGHGWKFPAWDNGDGYTCPACIRDFGLEEDYIESFVGKPRQLLNPYLVNPAEHGWVEIDIDFVVGDYGGQKADPRSIMILLRFEEPEDPIESFFTGSHGQFEVHFRVWVKAEDAERAERMLKADRAKPNGQRFTDLPFDPAVEKAKLLRGGHSDYYQKITVHFTQDMQDDEF